jgi:hypothetical protein
MSFNVSGILPEHGWLTLAIAVAAVGCNVPLGYLREGARKYSPAWFLYIHLSVPLIAALRIFNHLSYWNVPLFIGCAVAGQLLGGRIRRTRRTGA